jgi:hypothetical protein
MGLNKTTARSFQPHHHTPIRAAIHGDDQCAALGIIVRSPSPVLTLCRRLVEAGFDPVLCLDAYRDDVLCLRIRSIGEAATLEVNGHTSGFIRCRNSGGAAPPMRSGAFVRISAGGRS